MSTCELLVFDMAGTTIHDSGEVRDCFQAAAEETDLRVTREKILSMMGWSKRLVFKTLWTECLGGEHAELEARIDSSYEAFRRILERHYQTEAVRPADGCLECFEWLHEHGIKIALTTGFYRRVTDIILQRVGWDVGLDENFVGGPDSIIQASVTSDAVHSGRPAADMIRTAMSLLAVTDPKRVVKIGDTPSDLQAGKNAGCLLSLAVTNGSHSRSQLESEPNDGLLGSLAELKDVLK
jgi:phosphonatase-like hydrolase